MAFGNVIRDLTGTRPGGEGSRLTVVRLVEYISRGRSRWECLCDCGKPKIAQHRYLTKGHTKSCGCLSPEQARINIEIARTQQMANRRAFVDTLMECVTRFPQTAGEIRQALLESWGSHNERTFWRWLAYLVKAGSLEQIGEKRPMKYQVPRRRLVRSAGTAGPAASSHP